MEREAFLYVKAKLLNSSIANRKNFGSGKVHFNLTGTYMNDPGTPRDRRDPAGGSDGKGRRASVRTLCDGT